MIHKESSNPLELFQIWLNLPAAKKFVEPYYAMLWKESIPVYRVKDAGGLVTEVEGLTITSGNGMEVRADRSIELVNGKIEGRFALHADGREEEPPGR